MIVIQFILALILIALVAIQSESGGVFQLGSLSAGYGAKRGIERFLFGLTIAIAVIFTAVSIAMLLIQS